VLAIPSLAIGYFAIEPMLFGGWLDNAITIFSYHESMAILKKEFHGAGGMIIHALTTLPFWLMMGGIISAWVLSLYKTPWADWMQKKFHRTHFVLVSLYGFDRFNEIIFVRGVKRLSGILWRVSDITLIDTIVVNGSARLARFMGKVILPIQTGYVYHYAFFMIFSLLVILTWVLFAGKHPLLTF
jgi:NADH-quinone oxidoreductase subunit L